MEKLLLIRFSALGDVAMTVPVIYALAKQYPNLEITILSKESMHPYFKDMPSNVKFKGVRLKADYHGINGLMKLYNELDEENFNAVGDLHDVLRSKFLRWRFSLNKGIKIQHINKGHSQKKALISAKKKQLIQLPSSFERYAQVLTKLGYPVQLEFSSIWSKSASPPLSNIPMFKAIKGDDKWVGIAPFAAHPGKIYPLEKMAQVLAALEKIEGIQIFLFGAGKKEKDTLEQWANFYSKITSIAGKYSKHEELILISHLDVMVSMDSANMHLASLVGTPVISIWGATHPCLGFMGWGQNPDNAIQINLNCRPCSVYGKKPCARGDLACLNRIQPKTIVNKVLEIINKK